MGLIYVDTCVLVYATEDGSPRGDRARAALFENSDRLATTELVLMECRVKPLSDGDFALADRYAQTLESFEWLPIGSRVFRRATELRARFGLKTPDALHLAAAQTNGCDSFWTDDDRLRSAAGTLALEVDHY